MMAKYESNDIVLRDAQNNCDVLTYTEGGIPKAYTHDAIISGWGRAGVYEYYILKQSWGEKFAHGGYMKI